MHDGRMNVFLLQQLFVLGNLCENIVACMTCAGVDFDGWSLKFFFWGAPKPSGADDILTVPTFEWPFFE
jgi:hypothetical protein